jgi:serine phosphatase RsbU (regulator of sigma subunit)
MIPEDRSEAVPLRTPNVMIGAIPARTYKSDTVTVPPGASVYVFSDGVFEIVTRGGEQWVLQDFLPLLLKPAVEGVGECARLFDEVTSVARPGGLDDDFSMVVLTFA